MKISEFTIDELLLKSKLAISNSLSDPPIMLALAVYGYDEIKMNQGLNLHNETETLVHIQAKEYGEQYKAYNDYEDAKKAASIAYNKTYRVAGIALSDNKEAKTSLKLGRSRNRSFSEWLLKLKTFYTNLLGNDDYIAAMQKYGYTAEKIQAEFDLVMETEAKDFGYDKEKGEAQQATLNRNKKVDLLANWYRDFVEIAKIALEGNPQWLEKLGIITK